MFEMSYLTQELFTNEQIREINKRIKKQLDDVDGSIKEPANMPAGDAIKTGEFFIIPCGGVMDLIHPWLHMCQKCNRDQIGFDINWDFHLDTCSYNIYEIGGEYTWHTDGIYNNPHKDIKLTCLLNLSEESYEGGEFNLDGDDDNPQFTSGKGLIVHPYRRHKVTPVTKGKRITLTYWAVGPSWK